MLYTNIISKRLASFISGLTALMLIIGGSPMLSVQNANAEQLTGIARVSTNLADGSYEIQKLDGTLMSSGAGTVETLHVLPTSPMGTGYKLIFNDVDGFDTPDLVYFNLFVGDDLSFGPTQDVGIYVPSNQENPTGTVRTSTNLADGSYEIQKLDGALMSSGAGTVEIMHVLPVSPMGTGYQIIYGDAAGFITPDTVQFNLQADDDLSFGPDQGAGIYIPENQENPTGTVRASTNIADGSYEIQKLDGTVMSSGSGTVETMHVLPTSPMGTGYQIVYGDVVGFITPDTVQFNLQADDDMTYGPAQGAGIYIPENQENPTGTVRVRTNIPDGSYEIQKLDGTLMSSGGGTEEIMHVLPTSPMGTGYQIVFNDVVGSVTPATIQFTLMPGDDLSFEGIYTLIVTPDTGTVIVNQIGANGTVELSGPSPATITDATYTNPDAGAGEYTLTSIASPAGFALDNVTDGNGNVLTDPYTQTLAKDGVITYNVNYTAITIPVGTVIVNQIGANGTVELSGPSPATVTNATYTDSNARTGEYTLTLITPPAGFALDNVTDENGNVLTDPYAQILGREGMITYNVNYIATATGTVIVNQIGANGTVELSGPTPFTITSATYSESNSIIGDYALTSITPPAGFALDNVTDGNGNVLTAPYAQTLTEGETITYNVNYRDISVPTEVTLTKTANPLNVRNNDIISYTITLTRTNNNIPGSLNFTVTDSVTNSATLSGNNGGSISVFGNGTCTGPACSAQEIYNGPIDVALNAAGDQAVIRYDMRASSGGVPMNQNSTVTNTVTAVDSGGVLPDLTAVLGLTITGPTSSGPSGPTGGGGGGGGGGYHVYKGDMELKVEKLVSLDTTNYRDASSEELAMGIPENQSTRLYSKVLVTNLGKVSAKNVEFKHFFDTGESDIVAGDIENLRGAELDKHGNISIEKIKVNETVEFTYSILVNELGQNSNPAVDGVELLDFDSTLSRIQDSLTYLGIGDQFVSYLNAGEIPVAPPSAPTCGTPFNNSNILAIRVDTDKTHVRVGDIVNYTITLENMSDMDLSGIYVSHSYPSELNIVNAGGALNSGSELQWRRAIMRPGEKVDYRFSAKVIGGISGSLIYSITNALVSEFENIAPAESCLIVSDGTAPSYSLVQTGPSIFLLLILSVLSYLGYGAIQKRRKLKTATLKI